MTQANRFALTMDALTELAVEKRTTYAPSLPALSDILASVSPLPREALFLGMAEDNLTVLLNLFESAPGPMLVVGDSFTGKTTLLKIVARAAEIVHPPSEVRFCVLTKRAEEWDSFKTSPNLVGVHPPQSAGAQDLLNSLVRWAHDNRGGEQSVVLFVDDLDGVSALSREAEQNLRWLLLRGPSRRVWPLVTLNATRAKIMEGWLGFFRTRVFGRIENAQTSERLSGVADQAPANLIPGVQFVTREENRWLRFWIPAFD
jgi:hypothetical protein